MRLMIAAIALAVSGPAMAHPFFNAECKILQRNHLQRLDLTVNNGERLDLDAPLARLGDSIVTCKGDLGPGPAVTLNFLNTGDTCDLGPDNAPVAKTKIWTETIKANGEATLRCDFGPR
jgi:hypothetical protein